MNFDQNLTTDMLETLTIEDLYQAFKARLINETIYTGTKHQPNNDLYADLKEEV